MMVARLCVLEREGRCRSRSRAAHPVLSGAEVRRRWRVLAIGRIARRRGTARSRPAEAEPQ